MRLSFKSVHYWRRYGMLLYTALWQPKVQIYLAHKFYLRLHYFPKIEFSFIRINMATKSWTISFRLLQRIDLIWCDTLERCGCRLTQLFWFAFNKVLLLSHVVLIKAQRCTMYVHTLEGSQNLIVRFMKQNSFSYRYKTQIERNWAFLKGTIHPGAHTQGAVKHPHVSASFLCDN